MLNPMKKSNRVCYRTVILYYYCCFILNGLVVELETHYCREKTQVRILSDAPVGTLFMTNYFTSLLVNAFVGDIIGSGSGIPEYKDIPVRINT